MLAITCPFMPDFTSPEEVAPEPRPCQRWADTLCGPRDPTLTLDSATVSLALNVATEIVWALSGRRFGVCHVDTRPCPPNTDLSYMGMPWLGSGWQSWNSWDSGYWPRFWLLPQSCGCGDRCSTTHVPRINLRKTPVRAVSYVKIDGQVLSPSAYRLDKRRYLARIDGLEWPTAQNGLLDDDQVGTWSVGYSFGTPPPAAGQMAVSVLANEIAKACSGADCALPARITTLTRQGETVAFLDPQTFLKEGRTGLYLVDLFLASFNPNKLQAPAAVYRADAMHSATRYG